MDKYKETLEKLCNKLLCGGECSVGGKPCSLLEPIQELVDTTITPTIEEVKKEWEDDGWSFIGTKTIMICKYVGGNIFSTTDIQLNLNEKDCFIRGILNCHELQLLTKTFKALGWFDE